jgi:hypothetical protein
MFMSTVCGGLLLAGLLTLVWRLLVGGTFPDRWSARLPTVTVGRRAVAREGFPRILHLMYLPWDPATQKLCADQNAFDKRYLWHCQHVLGAEWTVRMWTFEELERAVQARHRGLWAYVLSRVTRPTQLVDFFRVWVVWTFGGVHLQYETRFDDIEKFVPRAAGARFFREFNASPFAALWLGFYRDRVFWHRQVAIQAFAAFPRHGLLRDMLFAHLDNLGHVRIAADRDIMWCGANHQLSHVVYTSPHADYELVNHPKCVFPSKGSWRGAVCPYTKTPCPPVRVLSISQLEALLRI